MSDQFAANNGSGGVPVGQKVVAIVDIVFASLGLLSVLGLLVCVVGAMFQLPELVGISAVAVLWTQIAVALVLSVFLLLAGIGMLSPTAKWGGIFAILFAIMRSLLLALQVVVVGIVLYHSSDSKEALGFVAVVGLLSLLGAALCLLNLIYGIKVLRRGGSAATVPFHRVAGPGRFAAADEVGRDKTTPYTRPSEQLSVQEIRNNEIVREHKLECSDPFGDPIRNLIGRGNDCAIRISADPYVSQHHCFLTMDRNGNHMLGDNGSSHNTFLLRSGRKTKITALTPIFSGDTIEICNTKLVVHMLSSRI